MKKGILTRIRKSKFGGYNYVGNFSHLLNCDMDIGSYCGSSCKLINVKVGRYCSIASDVKVIFGEHPSKQWVSTYPGFYSPNTSTKLSFTSYKKYDEYKYSDKINGKFVTIGNDVWIASDVKIMAGVTISDGAIIASGAIVTKDVAPYKIMGGIPAKEIGQRFEDEDIQFLLDNKWWEKDLIWIKRNSNCFSNIREYKEKILNEKEYNNVTF